MESLVIPDDQLSLREGAVAAWGKPGAALHRQMLEALTGVRGVSLDKPFAKLSARARETVLHGDEGTKKRAAFEGVLPSLERRAAEYARRKSEEGGDPDAIFDYLERELGAFSRMQECDACAGARLRPAARSVRFRGTTLSELLSFPLGDVRARASEWAEAGDPVEAQLASEIAERAGFLTDVGLGYLALGRAVSTLRHGRGAARAARDASRRQTFRRALRLG